jgi:2-polyprenyl-3-methyl-5-hydroxy-6-metoxy-1,4-benzoquinol methylase
MLNFSTRSQETEIMDDLDMKGEELASTLRQIENVNKWLGGLSIALSGVKRLLKKQSKTGKTFKIIDIGCGGGETLRLIADWCRENEIQVELLGIDANGFTIEFAKNNAKAYPEISFEKVNIFSEEFSKLEYDIALCSLFLHHFQEEEILSILNTINQSSKIGFIINDLQRSKIAYFLFDLVTRILGASYMVRHDGKLSVKKSFLKKELQNYLKLAGLLNYQISWKWAFRYQVIAHKLA